MNELRADLSDMQDVKVTRWHRSYTSPIGPPAVGPNVTPSSYVRDLSTTEKWDLAMRIARRVYVKDGRLAIGDSPPLLWAGGASAVRCDATTMHCYDGGWRHLLVLTGPTGKTVARGSVSREEGERLRRADARARIGGYTPSKIVRELDGGPWLGGEAPWGREEDGAE